MNTIDALAILNTGFISTGVLTDRAGNLTYDYHSDFAFFATDQDDTTLRLSASLHDIPPDPHNMVKYRLLEANMLGVETGAGKMAQDPVLPGGYALIDTIDLAEMDEDDLKLRVVDFILYVEFWRAEGIEKMMQA